LSGAFLFNGVAEATRAMTGVANPAMDKPAWKIKNGIRDRNFRSAEQTKRANA
jgi:hypothetical protein